MIFTDRTIIVQKGTSSINDTIVLYRGDKDVEIRFSLNEGSPFKFGSGASPNIIEKTEAAYGQLIIKRPNDLPAVFSEIAPTNEGKIVFTITAEMIDEITEVGNYTFQIRLLDESRNSRATLPEVVNGIEIREPIATEDVSTTNEVGEATVGYAMTTAGVSEDAFDGEGNYNKTTWGTGDRITAAKLNKIEAGIDGVNKKVASGGIGGGVADSVDWSNVQNKPTIPTNTSQLTNDSGFITNVPDEYITETELNARRYASEQYVDDAVNNASISGGYIHPATHPASMITGLSTVATSGSYNDLTDKPIIPTRTSELANNSDFVDSAFVSRKIAEASLSGGEVDLSGYVTKGVGNASQIQFADGQTFQAKLEAGTLKGEKGDKGDTGEQGPKGDKGDPGDTGVAGANGQDGEDGATFTPSVDAQGNLSWTNDKGLVNPPTVNIKGDKGDPGSGTTTDSTNNAILLVTQAQYDSLVAGETVSINGVEHTYDENRIYGITDATESSTFNGILTSPNGTEYILTVDNNGNLSTTLKPVLCTGVSLDANSLTFETSATQTLHATFTPSNTTENKVWSSDSPSIARVANGVVTPVSNGSCTITITCGSFSATCSVTVNMAEEPEGPGETLDFTNYAYNTDTYTNPTTTDLHYKNSYYVLSNINKNVSEGVLTMTEKEGLTSGVNSYALFRLGIGDNNKYYCRALLRTASQGVTAGINGGGATVPADNEWHLISYISVDASVNSCGFAIDFINAQVDGPVELKELMKINLTEVYGAGNEPDKATCDTTFTTYKTGLIG